MKNGLNHILWTTTYLFRNINVNIIPEAHAATLLPNAMWN